ncbi:MAG TPA: DNA repair protein RecN [Sediminispirochaeta sp.]|nr:DNA repair protein RecN [Sediminispirochaeta sp.]
MLEELRIRNYALIDLLELNFGKGLNILTGETGAGKSIIVGALGLILGDKGDSGAIRSGEDEAEVSGLIRVDGNKEVLSWLEERDIAPEDGTVLLRRLVRANGKGSSYIQNSKVTRRDLQEFTTLLVDMHGQHEHQSLLSLDKHRTLLDQYAGNEELAAGLYAEFYRLTRLKQELEDLKKSERQLLREKELLEFSVQEIEEAKLRREEEEELEQERRILNRHEKLLELFHLAHENLAEARGGALAGLREAKRTVDQISEIMPKLEDHRERLSNAFYEVEDILETLKDSQDSMQFSPGRLDEVEQRLQLIHRLESKYGDGIDEVLRYRDEALEKLSAMENSEERRETLKGEIQDLEARVVEQAKELSRKRREAAAELKVKIEGNLRKLGMKEGSFDISTTAREGKNGRASCGPHGYDRVEFLISPNKGEPLKPLKDVASGGEISRIMLALKSVFAESDKVASLIFDEIDSGIGGEVALAVGEHLSKLAAHKQIICITHLASIAVRADTHLKVQKYEKKDRTVTKVDSLSQEERIEEIARMLAGDQQNEASRRHALELLQRFQD